MNMQSIVKIMVTGLIGMTSMSLVAEGSWTRKADMPTARFGLTSSVVNGKIYAIGGATGPGADVQTVEEYDPATDSWRKMADMLTAVSWYSASVVDDRIYAIGGATAVAGRSKVQEYDPATDTWARKADMPTPRWALSASAVNGRIYAIGGALEMAGLRTVEEYDPTTNTWTRKADMPTPRILMSTSVVDGIIYAIGGTSSQGGSLLSKVEAYDPATNTWTTKAPIPTARCFFSTSVVNGKIYAIGGCTHPYNSGTFSSVEAYDPATDSWAKMDDMPTPRKALATSVVNGKIYAIGGNSVPAFNSCIPTVEEYGLIPPPPDFNGDGMVDIKDLLRLIGSWNQDDSLLDIAPPPFGDGIVDALDLELLMNYWEQPVDDPTLLAHWSLDETEGMIVSDIVGNNNGYALGDPVWQPDGGQVDGALLLDGVDDFISAPAILNPSDGPFSIFVWIYGGSPGQAIISETGGPHWLSLDLTAGYLMTELTTAGRYAAPLLSQTTIDDGNWHRIGLVWDGSRRALYVDDNVVAQDAQNNLHSTGTGLYIGCGNPMQPSTFFSGMIDDIRIYNRAVSP